MEYHYRRAVFEALRLLRILIHDTGIANGTNLDHLCESGHTALDDLYTGSGEKVQSHGYTPHIRSCGEEKKELERNPDFRARRWVVEATHSFFNRFRKLLVRYEKKAANYLTLVQFACAVIVWRKFLRVHC